MLNTLDIFTSEETFDTFTTDSWRTVVTGGAVDVTRFTLTGDAEWRPDHVQVSLHPRYDDEASTAPVIEAGNAHAIGDKVAFHLHVGRIDVTLWTGEPRVTAAELRKLADLIDRV